METDRRGQGGGCWGRQQGPESGHQPQPLRCSPADFAPGGGGQKRKHLGPSMSSGQGPAGHWEKAVVLIRQGSRLDGDMDTCIPNHQQCSRMQRRAARSRSYRGT